MSGLKTLAIESSTIYRREKEGGKIPNFIKIIERVCKNNQEIFPEYTLAQLKRAVLLEHSKLKKERRKQLNPNTIAKIIPHTPKTNIPQGGRQLGIWENL